MSSTILSPGRLIIYDSNCHVCLSLGKLLQVLTNISERQLVAYKDLSPENKTKVDLEKFRNQMALIDLNGQETIYGASAIEQIFGSVSPSIALLFKIPGVRILFKFLYKTLAYNRYIITPPKNGVECDCFPEDVLKYRLVYLTFSIGFSIVLTCLFGISIKGFFTNISSSDAALQMLLIAGTGWLVQILVAFLTIKEKVLTYIGHLGSIMVTGLIVLVPWLLMSRFPVLYYPFIPFLSVCLSSLTMLRMHAKRVKFLGMHFSWNLMWFFNLQSTAIMWVYIFYF